MRVGCGEMIAGVRCDGCVERRAFVADEAGGRGDEGEGSGFSGPGLGLSGLRVAVGFWLE